MEFKEKQSVEDVSIKCDQLISLLMVLGTHAKDIETEELSSTIFLARNIAKEIDNFVGNLRLGKL
ncbi:hypothetical protein [Pantoea ananatis]|uniref:hypothetical protein n=1 Tax=Pantoea ananas TaxID=553 RepID=UPI002350C605|nr:hypothetical protein [Pantoea ananatis]MDC7862243.1 hypothetical protein [Pantoea ananatis]